MEEEGRPCCGVLALSARAQTKYWPQLNIRFPSVHEPSEEQWSGRRPKCVAGGEEEVCLRIGRDVVAPRPPTT